MFNFCAVKEEMSDLIFPRSTDPCPFFFSFIPVLFYLISDVDSSLYKIATVFSDFCVYTAISRTNEALRSILKKLNHETQTISHEYSNYLHKNEM